MLYNVVLVSAVQQSESSIYIYIYPHIPSILSLPPTLPIPPLYVITKHRVDLPVLCSSFPIAIHFTFGRVYMSMLLSHFVPASPSPAVSSSPFSTSLLCSCPTTRFGSTVFFRFHICLLAYSICFSLSDLLHSV